MTNLNRRSFARLLPFLAALPVAAAKRTSEAPFLKGLSAKVTSLKPAPAMPGSGLGVDAKGRIEVKVAGISMRMELAEGRSLLFRDGVLVGVMDANGCMEPSAESPACRILGTIVDNSQ